MADTAEKPDNQRPMRADALRSRERIICAARSLFATGTSNIPISDIAKKAAVGVGTFYRHFENRQMLLRAVYQHEIDAICDEGKEMLDYMPADKALWKFFNFTLEHSAKNAGLAQALANALAEDPKAVVYGENKLLATVSLLMKAAVSEGSIRPDIQPETVIASMNRLCSAQPNAEWLDQTKAIMRLVFDGLRKQDHTVSSND